MLPGGGAKFLLEEVLVITSVLNCFHQCVFKCHELKLTRKTNARKNSQEFNQDTNKNEREAEFIKG